MKSSGSFYVFKKWQDAPPYAFGSKNKPSLVPAEDKEAYKSIYDECLAAAIRATTTVRGGDRIVHKPMNFSPVYGSRGHRPVDIWISLCGENSETFGQMPQVYAIASSRGLEIGFSVSIDEADYYDPAVKERNRTIVPILNSKLPQQDDSLVRYLDQLLLTQDNWHYNAKTRLSPTDPGYDRYASLADMLIALKSSADVTGGGTICRQFGFEELPNLDIDSEFALALDNFLPLIGRCAPSPWDMQIVSYQDAVSRLSDDKPFDPDTATDARIRVLSEVARRQGQAKFRRDLFKAYDGKCAVTGTSVPSVLQAAHITPYLGVDTNHVTNGLLLRADIHTLFDLRLLRIDPATLKIQLCESLMGTPYAQYDGKILATAMKPSERPSRAALEKQFDTAT